MRRGVVRGTVQPCEKSPSIRRIIPYRRMSGATESLPSNRGRTMRGRYRSGLGFWLVVSGLVVARVAQAQSPAVGCDAAGIGATKLSSEEFRKGKADAAVPKILS